MAIERFPKIDKSISDEKNAAIPLFGRRFHPDQTIVEYLVEFLLVCNSPKVVNQDLNEDVVFPYNLKENKQVVFKPKTLLELKFFAFFAASKLETRFEVHRNEFQNRLKLLENSFKTNSFSEDPSDFSRVLQSFFSGFVGVAGSRTWATHTFFPVCNSLLGCEVMWSHTKALKDKNEPKSWDETKKFFETDKHNFLARGGHQLYLQLFHLNFISQGLIEKNLEDYTHILKDFSTETILPTLSKGIRDLLFDLESDVVDLVRFLKDKFGEHLDIDGNAVYKNGIKCGWIPKTMVNESVLFAWELNNICSSTLNTINKLEHIQTLCVLQVLRTLCFQSSRYCDYKKSTNGFLGNYTWVISHPRQHDAEIKKLSQQNYKIVENMIYSAVRSKDVIDELSGSDDEEELNIHLRRGDDNGFKFFRKLGKALEIVIPRTGANAYFTLPSHVIRCLVSALVPPGEKIRLTRFTKRVYMHYGIAISNEDLTEAYKWSYTGLASKTAWNDYTWFSDELKSAGYLIPLSDSISIVENPYG
jgi:hypothetical protein